MSVKYRIDFEDAQGINEWSLRVIDKTYTSYSDRVIADGGTVQSIGCLPLEITELVEYERFNLDGEAFELSYGDRGDDLHKAIKGSALKFIFTAENSNDLAFIEAIAQTQEQAYFVDLYKNGSLFWRGGILQDLIRIPYTYYPIQVEIQATCGLARLKGMAKEIDEYVNILSSIAFILRQLDNGDLWASTDPFIRTSVRWFDLQMSTADGLDSLAYSRLFKLSTQYDLDDEGVKEYRDWYEWMEKVLETFGARIFMAEGVWQIVQIDEISNSPSKYNLYAKEYVYAEADGDPSGVVGVISDGTAWTTFFELQTSGVANRVKRDNSTYTYIPAYKELKVNWNAPYAVNQLIGIERINSTSTVYSVFLGNVQSLVSADPNFTNQVRIYVKNEWFKVSNASAFGQQFYLRQWLTVKITGASTYYLQPSGTGYVWSTINSSFVNATSDGLHNVSGSSTALINGRNAPFFLGGVIQSDEIPIDGVLSVSMRIEVLNSSFGTHSNVSVTGLSALDGNAYYSRGTLFRATYWNSSNQAPYDGVDYVVTNPTLVESTFIKEYDDALIGDSIDLTENRRIRVYNSISWENSILWQFRKSGTAKSIVKLRLSQAFNYFAQPTRLFDLTYIGNPNPLRAMRLGSKDYIWTWLEITARGKAASAVIKSEAVEVRTNGGGYTVDDSLQLVGEGLTDDSGLRRGNPIDGVVDYDSGVIAENLSGAKTSITIVELNNDLALSGETVRIYQPANGYFEDVVLTQNALQGATSLSIESKTFTIPMMEGAILQRTVAKSTFKTRALELLPITRIPNAEMIHDINSGYSLDGSGYIDVWKDSSGENHNSTGTDLEPNNNGLFNAYFNGSSSKLVNTTLDPGQPFSLALLIKLDETNTGRFIVCNDNNNFYIETGASDSITVGTSVKTGAAEIRRGEWVVFQLEMDGGSSRARANNDSWTALNLDADSIKHPIFGSDGSSNFCEMNVSAICIFEGILTAEQWENLYLNLKSRL